eukprot:PRCOL_00001355-RA
MAGARPVRVLVAKERLLRLVAPTQRGGLVQSAAQREAIDDAVRTLADAGAATATSTGPLQGRWRLIYSSVPEVWRASPFYWLAEDALRAATASNPAVAPTVAAAIDALRAPLAADFGDADQIIDLSGAYSGTATLESRVGLTLLKTLGPLAPSITFITECRLTVLASSTSNLLGAELDVSLTSTRVDDTGTPLDGLSAPLEQMLAAGAGNTAAAPSVTMTTSFCDMDLRISRIEGKTAREARLPGGSSSGGGADMGVYHVWARCDTR